MARPTLRIYDRAEFYTITVQPGEVVQDLVLNVYDLLANAETVASCQADDGNTVTAAVADGKNVLIDVVGPANGVQKPVRLTVHGSLASVRHISLVVIGCDPFSLFTLQTPNIYLRWRGSWQPDQTYLPYDLVLYGGITYLALQGSSALTPDTHATVWMAWAGTGGGGGTSGALMLPDVGGSGRLVTLRATWLGPGDDDWNIQAIGVQP